MSNENVTEQQPPTDTSGKDVWLLVLRDMEDRRREGIAKYGMPVMPFNGRDALIDAYQEALDMCVYLRQAIEERAVKVDREARLQADLLAAFERITVQAELLARRAKKEPAL